MNGGDTGILNIKLVSDNLLLHMSRDHKSKDFEASDLLKRKTWDDFFFRTPCVRSSYLWGIGCGSIMMAHKMRLYSKLI